MNKGRCNNIESLALSRKSAILMPQRYKWRRGLALSYSYEGMNKQWSGLCIPTLTDTKNESIYKVV